MRGALLLPVLLLPATAADDAAGRRARMLCQFEQPACARRGGDVARCCPSMRGRAAGVPPPAATAADPPPPPAPTGPPPPRPPPPAGGSVTVTLRSRHRLNPRRDDEPQGRTTPALTWAERFKETALPVAETAIVIVDMWDFHPCPCALARFRSIAEKINDTIASARAAGMLVIHAPSDVVGGYTGTYNDSNHGKYVPVKPFYRDYAARQWVAALPTAEPPAPANVTPPQYPIDSSDGGCDCSIPPYPGRRQGQPWDRETDKIYIDNARDAIIDGNDGASLYNIVAARGLRHLIYMGVATNMCVMGRAVAIEAAKGWGLDTILARDLTDTMYNPERPPYLADHDAGTDLFIQFVEKFGLGEPPSVWDGVHTLSRYDLMQNVLYE